MNHKIPLVEILGFFQDEGLIEGPGNRKIASHKLRKAGERTYPALSSRETVSRPTIYPGGCKRPDG